MYFDQVMKPSGKDQAACHVSISLYPSQADHIGGPNYEVCNDLATVFDMIHNNMQCSLRFIKPEPEVGGTLLPSGKWTGSMALLNEKLADIPAAYMAFTQVRLMISDILYPTFVANQLTILSATMYHSGNLAFFRAFSLPVWFFILLCFIITLLANMYHTYKVLPEKFSSKYQMINELVSYINDQFLVLINKPIITKNFKKGLYNKVVTIIYGANCLFWVQLFLTEILSSLTNNSMVAIDSIDQLLDIVRQHQEMKILMSKSSWLYNNYMQTNFPELNKYEDFKYYNFKSSEVLSQILSGNTVMIEDEPNIEEILETHPTLPLHKSRKNQVLGIGGFLIRKTLDNDFKRVLIYKFTRLVESGILKFRARLNKLIAKAIEIGKNEFALAETMVKNDDRFQTLSLKDIKLIFEILLLGQILPFFCFIFELASNKFIK